MEQSHQESIAAAAAQGGGGDQVPHFTFTSSRQDAPKAVTPRRGSQESSHVAWFRRERFGATGLEEGESSGRERLKRHRSEVAGRVVVPDKWSKEEMLRDWLDFASFDALLAPKGFDLARAALVAERRREQAKERSSMSNNKAAYELQSMHFSATRCSS